MKEKLILMGFVGSLLVLVFVPYVVMISSASFQYCEANHGYYPKEQTAPDKPPQGFVAAAGIHIPMTCTVSFTNDNGGALTAWATFWLTIATGLLVWITRQQYVTNRAQLRAYVFVESCGITDGPSPAWATAKSKRDWPFWNVVIKNSGITPAYEVRHWTWLSLAPIGQYGHLNPPKPKDKDVTDLAPNEIGPQGVTFADRQSNTALTKEMKASMAVKSPGIPAQLVVYGIITYKDAFGRFHWTKYKLGLFGKYPPQKGARLVFLADGNKAT